VHGTHEQGQFAIDDEDYAVRGALVLRQGVTSWPAPLPPAAAPTAAKPAPVKLPPTPEELAAKAAAQLRNKVLLVSGMAAVLVAVGLGAGESLTVPVTVLALACLAGSPLVSAVTPALHSPLMSVTNAISGLTAVGGLVTMGGGLLPATGAHWLAAMAVFVSMINIGGGFVMTSRMLGMFKRKDDAPEPVLIYALPAAMVMGASVFGVGAPGLVLLASALFCVFAIGGLSSQATANFGNKMGLIGVGGGLLVTTATAGTSVALKQQMGLVMAAGAALGAGIANKVAVTDLPQLVAAFHALVGLAAVATALSSHMTEVAHHSALVALALGKSAAAKAAAAKLAAGFCGVTVVHSVTTYLAAIIGAVTLTGSAVAFAKLQGLISGTPLTVSPCHSSPSIPTLQVRSSVC